ncbi:MAG: hypothetical protein HOE19_02840 [Candidatus Komeilibacteria bacterium]|nr:hypothetical protein [Candidatus Komeilibacteria bacterium]MBT4447257.1 hypothetical protein [Candidatus Komeilibacteria bacterium]
MSIRSYNLIMLLATALAWFGFFIIIRSFDPTEGSWLVYAMFYSILFLSILGTLSLLGFLSRSLFNKKRGRPRIMAIESFRQAIIFSAVLILALMLQAARILTWWNMALLIILATVVEFVILVFRQNDERVKN